MKEHAKISLIEVIKNSLLLNQFSTVFNVPGYGGTEVLDKLKGEKQLKVFVNLNEEAAFSISYGVSANGKRSALLIKSQGFTKAMNAVTSSLSTEINSANLIFVFDDTEGRSSDNILPTESIVSSSEIPFIMVGKDPARDIANGIKKSEKLKVPVALIIDCKKLNDLHHKKLINVPFGKIKDIPVEHRVACPVLTKYQRARLENKLNNKNKKVITPVITDIKELLPPRLCAELSRYEKFIQVFKKYRPSFVSGDAGTSTLFAFAPFHCVDTCTYMGGAPGMAIGAMLAGKSDAIAMTGDFSFLAAGILGFNEAIIHEIPLKLIIFNNGKAHATGGQELHPQLLNHFKMAYKDHIFNLELKNIGVPEIRSSLLKFLKQKKLSILVLEI